MLRWTVCLLSQQQEANLFGYIQLFVLLIAVTGWSVLWYVQCLSFLSVIERSFVRICPTLCFLLQSYGVRLLCYVQLSPATASGCSYMKTRSTMSPSSSNGYSFVRILSGIFLLSLRGDTHLVENFQLYISFLVEGIIIWDNNFSCTSPISSRGTHLVEYFQLYTSFLFDGIPHVVE
jgi:hypothetical protein